MILEIPFLFWKHFSFQQKAFAESKLSSSLAMWEEIMKNANLFILAALSGQIFENHWMVLWGDLTTRSFDAAAEWPSMASSAGWSSFWVFSELPQRVEIVEILYWVAWVPPE